MRIITGMHRSGTSLTARLFYEAGADLGDPETFHRPDRWNPDGYFEQPDIHAINIPLVNGPWGKSAYFRLPTTEKILRRAARRADQIRRVGRRYDGKIVKENRFCLTLPAMLAYGARAAKLLVCLRDPISVARSLRKRNWITLRHGYRLWLIHNRRLLENADGIPVWFLYYPNLLAPDSFIREMKPAFAFFGLDVSDPELERLRERSVNPQWNHWPAGDTDYPPEVEQLWKELMDRHARQQPSSHSHFTAT